MLFRSGSVGGRCGRTPNGQPLTEGCSVHASKYRAYGFTNSRLTLGSVGGEAWPNAKRPASHRRVFGTCVKVPGIWVHKLATQVGVGGIGGLAVISMVSECILYSGSFSNNRSGGDSLQHTSRTSCQSDALFIPTPYVNNTCAFI